MFPVLYADTPLPCCETCEGLGALPTSAAIILERMKRVAHSPTESYEARLEREIQCRYENAKLEPHEDDDDYYFIVCPGCGGLGNVSTR